jgi:hypothetical protein
MQRLPPTNVLGAGSPPTMPAADFSTVFSVRIQMPNFSIPRHREGLPA